MAGVSSAGVVQPSESETFEPFSPNGMGCRLLESALAALGEGEMTIAASDCDFGKGDGRLSSAAAESLRRNSRSIECRP